MDKLFIIFVASVSAFLSYGFTTLAHAIPKEIGGREYQCLTPHDTIYFATNSRGMLDAMCMTTADVSRIPKCNILKTVHSAEKTKKK
jgi:hypothetical protein